MDKKEEEMETEMKEELHPFDKIKPGFFDLPLEMREMILKNLDLGGKKLGRQVCQEWRQIIDKQSTFRIGLSDGNYETFRNFPDDQPIDTLIVQNFQTKGISNSTTRSGLNKNIKNLVLGAGAGIMQRPEEKKKYDAFVTWWHNADICGELSPNTGTSGISGENLRLLLEMNPGIKGLAVSKKAFFNVRANAYLGKLQMNNLTRLEVNYGTFTVYTRTRQPRSAPFLKLLANVFPSLKTFFFSATCWKSDFKMLVAMYQFIANHHKTLKKLKIHHSTVYHITDANDNPEKGHCNMKKFQELRANFLKVRLEYIYMDFLKAGPNNGQRWRDLEQEFIGVQNSLIDARFVGNARYTIQFDRHIIFPVIQNTLTRLQISWHCINMEPFNCRVLSGCTQLKKLKLNILRQGFYAYVTNPETIIVNVPLLPTTIRSLDVCGMFNDADVRWISINMRSLEKIRVSCLRTPDHFKTYNHFRHFLNIPSLARFTIGNFYCQKIAKWIQGQEVGTEGIRLMPGYNTKIIIDRTIYEAGLRNGEGEGEIHPVRVDPGLLL